MWRLLAIFGLILAVIVPVVARAAHPNAGQQPWSFKPLVTPKLPQVKNDSWAHDDIDRFILARMEAAEIEPNDDADPLVLLRRLTFDLTGLPPTEEQVQRSARAGEAKQNLDALVDELLASPRFGERCARHWLDVVRYADSVGRNWNAPFTYAWRYRDYVIDALNADKPYDRFILEQLAGDLLPAKTVAERRENLTATGFLALGSLDLQALDSRQFELDTVDDQIDVTSRALLGLTISCARCHDHKYDPVTMHDYYALAGIFYSSKVFPGVAYRGRGNGYLDHENLVQLPVSLSGRTTLAPIVPGIHSMSDYQSQWSKGNRNVRFTTDPNLAMGAGEDEPLDCAIRIKGDPHEHGPTPARGDIKISGLPAMKKPSAKSSGRLELAQWIASPRNPLTARVMVNRVWLHLIGRPLAETPDDFGVTSEPPSHPELLDHLATRFIADGWSVKKLIRAIVLSRTYRQSSNTQGHPARDKDPQNILCWRANLKRLEFEPLRDSLLAVAGELSTDRPEGIQVSGVGGKSGRSQVASLLDLDDPYRTIYLPVIRAHVPDAYSTFDFPDPCQISGRREVTTVAPQALFFMNGSLVTHCASTMAGVALEAKVPNERARVDWCYRRLFGRPATKDEQQDALELLQSFRSCGSGINASSEGYATLIQALMASAEFRYVK